MKRYYIFFALLIACNSGDKEKDAIQTIKNFLNWYEANYKQANSFDLVNQGDSVFYSVNFDQTEKYLSFLKSSGFVSDTYLNNFRNHFNKAEENFKAHPVNDGPPEGFDYDIVILTQEPELVFEKKNNPTIITSKFDNNSATLTLDIGMELIFKLSYESGGWKIDEISYSN